MPPASNNPYRKLPGSGGTIAQRRRLWLAPDHVLAVASSPVGERYRRFYFADIQAFVQRPTATWIVRAVGWFLVAALFAIGLGSDTLGVRVGCGSAAAVCVIFCVVNLVWGKTCACFVKTAVQFERLPSLGRERTVRRVLAQLRPLIEQAQRKAVSTTGT